MKKTSTELWVTWFGCGRSPKAPGTVGTLGAIPFVLSLAQLGPIPYMVITYVLILVSIPVINSYQKATGTEDSSRVVIDEVAGFLITMTWLPMGWKSLALGFLFFRILDIWKPWLIGRLDRSLKGGLGVMADDIVAGMVANIGLQVILAKTNWLL